MCILDLRPFLCIVDDLERFLFRIFQRFLVTALQFVSLSVFVLRIVELVPDHSLSVFDHAHDRLKQKNSEKNKENENIDNSPDYAPV